MKRKKYNKAACILFLFVLVWINCIYASESNKVLVLCYHDIPEEVKNDKFAVDQKTFVMTVEYLKSQGFNFINFDTLINFCEKKINLPDKAVLLTFDDAYKSFYEFVAPVLEKYEIPCILSVVSKWIDEKPESMKQYTLMNWEQLKEISQSKLIEIASHSHDLHNGILYNESGNEAPSLVSRYYFPETKTYESENSFLKRIRMDFSMARQILKEKLNISPRILCWPYGRYSHLVLEEAEKSGFPYTLILNDEIFSSLNLKEVDRIIIINNPDLDTFIERIRNDFRHPEFLRAIQVDLDYLFSEDTLVFEKNLGKLLDRIKEMKISHVFLQAFSDIKGNGNIESLYFPNRILPVKKDIFNRTVHQLKTRADVNVFAWMPVYSFVLNSDNYEELLVQEYKNGISTPSKSWYKRLSPFSIEARKKIKMIFEDLAVYSWIDGILFQDDAYLNDYEDFNPQAIQHYKKLLNKEYFNLDELNSEEKQKWTELKTETINEFIKDLISTVSYYRPETGFARTFYSKIITDPESQTWFSQNFEKSIPLYDYLVIMTYPLMEKVKKPGLWLKQIVDSVKKYPGAIDKTVFKIQTFDWEKKSFVSNRTINEWLCNLVSNGAKHIAYYPDYYIENHPDLEKIKYIMSLDDFPYD